MEAIAPPELEEVRLTDLVTPTSLDLSTVSGEEVIVIGAWLQHQTAAAKWWLGDWLLHCDALWGDEFWQHVDPELNDPTQLATTIKVATVFSPEERSAHVTWDHHRVIAQQLDTPTKADKAKWLGFVIDTKCTVGDLAKRMREDVVDVGEADEAAPEPPKVPTTSLFRVSVKVPVGDAEKVDGLLDIVKSDIRTTFESSGVTVNQIETSRSDS